MRSFYTNRSQKHIKKTDNLTIFFALLGSARIKADFRKLMKLTPGVNFINICLLEAFMHENTAVLNFYFVNNIMSDSNSTLN